MLNYQGVVIDEQNATDWITDFKAKNVIEFQVGRV